MQHSLLLWQLYGLPRCQSASWSVTLASTSHHAGGQHTSVTRLSNLHHATAGETAGLGHTRRLPIIHLRCYCSTLVTRPRCNKRWPDSHQHASTALSRSFFNHRTRPVAVLHLPLKWHSRVGAAEAPVLVPTCTTSFHLDPTRLEPRVRHASSATCARIHRALCSGRRGSREG